MKIPLNNKKDLIGSSIENKLFREINSYRLTQLESIIISSIYKHVEVEVRHQINDQICGQAGGYLFDFVVYKK